MEDAFRNTAIRVLLADDHVILRDGLRAAFAGSGDVDLVAEAGDGREAVDKALSDRPDVVVMDIFMPVMNGIEALRTLRRLGIHARVVMLSTHATRDHVSRAFDAGADGYVVKSAPITELLSAIAAVHRGEKFLGDSLAEFAEGASVIKAEAPDPVLQLSPRERQVLELMMEGHPVSEIAATMRISGKSIETYRSRMMLKLGVKNIVGLVKVAIRAGITTLD